MALDFSGYQIPGYLGAQATREGVRGATTALGTIIGEGFSRKDMGMDPDKPQINLAQGILGQGRTYYKDQVDKSLYPRYQDWLRSQDSGKFLKLAEAGTKFSRGGLGGKQYRYLQPGSQEWEIMGGQRGSGEDETYDPYLGVKDVTEFEDYMRTKYSSEDWSTGNYAYKTSMSPIEALFRRERHKPVANIYAQAGLTGTLERIDSMLKAPNLPDKEKKRLEALKQGYISATVAPPSGTVNPWLKRTLQEDKDIYGKDVKGLGILQKYLGKDKKFEFNPMSLPISHPVGSGSAIPIKKKTTTQTLPGQWGAKPFGAFSSLNTKEKTTWLTENNITPNMYKKAKKKAGFHVSHEAFIKKLEEGYTINPNTFELIEPKGI